MAGKKKGEEPVVVPESESGDAQYAEASAAAGGMYWHGTVKGCPFQNISVPTPLGPVTFHAFTNRVEEAEDGDRFVGARQLGLVRELSKEKVAALLKEIENRVVVAFDEKAADAKRHTTYKIRRLNDPKYKRDPRRETPLSRWLYLVPVEDPDGFNRTKEPAPIAPPA